MAFCQTSANPMLEAGHRSFEQRRYDQAERQLRAGLEMLPPGDPRRPEELHFLGTALRIQGKFAEAAAVFEERLKLEPDSEVAIDDLALVSMAVGDTQKALPLYEQLLASKQRQLEERQGETKRGGIDEMPLIPVLQKVARAQEFSLLHKKALETLNRVMAIRSKSVGSSHPDLAPDFLNLGRVYTLLKNGDMAAASFQFALEILEKAYGFDDARLLQPLDRLAGALRNLARDGDAETTYHRALSIRETTYGSLHPEIAQTLDALAKLLFDQKRYAEAEPMYRRSLGIWTIGLGTRNVLLALSIDNLAVTCAALKKFDEADELYKRSLSIRDADDVGSLRNLAVVAQARLKPKETETYLRRALSTIDASPEKSEVLAVVLKDLVEALRAQNKNAEATRMELRLKEVEAAAKAKAEQPPQQD